MQSADNAEISIAVCNELSCLTEFDASPICSRESSLYISLEINLGDQALFE